MTRLIVVFFLSITVHSWSKDNELYDLNEVDAYLPKVAFQNNEIHSRNLFLKANRLCDDAEEWLKKDLLEAMAKISNSTKMLKLVGTWDPKIQKLNRRVSRVHDDVLVGLWSEGLKKDGAEKVLQYRGEFLKIHESKPWILVKHITPPPRNVTKLTGFVVKDGRCLGTLEFIKVYKEFSMARLQPHWCSDFLKKTVAKRSEAIKGAKVYAVDDRHHRALMELRREGVTVKQVMDKLYPPVKVPPPPKPVSQLSFDGDRLSNDHFYTTEWASGQLRNVLKKSNLKLVDPITLTVPWDTIPGDVWKLKKNLKSNFGIKTIKLDEKRRVNQTARKLKTITLGRVSLQDTRISIVLEFLKNSSRCNDPAGVGVNFLYIPDSRKDWKEPTVSLTLENVTLETMIKKICKSTGLNYRVEHHAVVIAKVLPKEIIIPLALRRKHNAMIVSKASFMDTRVSTVFEFLVNHSKRVDPYHVGLPLSLSLSKVTDLSQETTVSMDFDDTPILDLLSYVCYAANLELTCKSGIVFIGPRATTP